MKTEDFLRRVLGEDGHYCLFSFRTKDDRRVQKFYTSVGDMADAARDLDSKGYDSYFALSTFKETNSRKVDNVHQLKSFFLDLDCGATKDYPDQDKALVALQGFCKTLSLPKPKLVNSGRGVHAYWFLSESIGLDDWLPVAERLKKLCVEHGLLADPAVTADAARVLRVPTTHNYKTDPPSPVEFFGDDHPDDVDFDKFSTLLGGGLIPVPKKMIPSGSNAVMDALMGNKQNKFKDIIAKTMNGTGCDQIKTIWKDQENCSEPMWRAGLSIAKFCVDSESAAHNISKKHEGYTPEDTRDKMELIKGPYKCTSFDEFNPDVCPNCPNWGKIKSPIVLGSSVVEATGEDNIVEVPALDLPFAPATTYIIPAYPRPFFRGTNGGVYIRTTNAEGDPDEKVVYHNDLYVVKRIQDVEMGEAVVVRLHLPKDGVREFTIPLTSVTSKEELRKQMSMNGVAVSRMDDLMTYMTTWVNELQATSVADEARRQFGWTDDSYTSFVVGNQEIFEDSIKANPPSTPTVGLFHAFEPKGTLQEWIDMANFYDRDGFELHQYIVASAFGSPLMALSPVACSGFHVHSKESGLGKTTAMFVGASVWGNPEELVLDKNDTQNSRMLRGEVYHNLPLYIDEMTNAKGDDLSDMVYQLTGGKQRNRMTGGGANTERARGKPWSLQAVTTGNTSIIEKISMYKNGPKAEAQRMLETKAVKLFKEAGTKSITDAHARNAVSIYGHAGTVYIQYVMKNLEEVKKLRDSVQAKIDEVAGLTAENRFWSAGAANNLTGVLVAKKIGLVNYDTNKLFKYVIKLLRENLNAVADMGSSAADTLNDYIHEHWGSILKIKSSDDLRKNQGNGMDDLVIPELDPKVRLVGRYETDLKRAYLIPKPLKAWCGRQQINYGSFIQELKDSFGAKTTKVRLTKGTTTVLPLTHVLFVDCSKVDVETQ
jgi:hypothetical protein